jgi:hypothetical protein
MTARFANGLYFMACTAAVLWVVFILGAAATVARPDWTVATSVATIGALVIWIVGRAARYLLVGR